MDMEAAGMNIYNLITSSDWEVYPYGRGTNPEDIQAAKPGAKAVGYKILTGSGGKKTLFNVFCALAVQEVARERRRLQQFPNSLLNVAFSKALYALGSGYARRSL